MDPLGKKRTSKHQKKFAARVQFRGTLPRCIVALSDPWAKIRDVPVGGVNAEQSTHGRDPEEDGKGGDEGTRIPVC